MEDGIDERLVFAPARAGDGARGLVEGLADFLFSLGDVDDDVGRAQCFGVGRRLVDDDRRVPVKYAMAAAGVAGGDAGDFERDDGGVEQCDDPADGADEALGLAGAPVHVLGPVEGEDFFRQIGAEHLRCGHSLALHRSAHILTFCVRDLL